MHHTSTVHEEVPAQVNRQSRPHNIQQVLYPQHRGTGVPLDQGSRLVLHVLEKGL